MSQVTELLINEFIFDRQFGHLGVTGGIEMEALGEYFRKLHREEPPDENRLLATLATLEERGFTPLDFLRSVEKVVKGAKNGICYSSRISSEKLRVLLQAGFLKEIGSIKKSSTASTDSIMSVTNLGKAATTLVIRCGDSLAKVNSEKMTKLLMKEFRVINSGVINSGVINSGRLVLQDGRPLILSGQETMRFTLNKEE